MLRENQIFNALSICNFVYLSEDNIDIRYHQNIEKTKINNLLDDFLEKVNVSFSLIIDDEEIISIPEERNRIDDIFLTLLLNDNVNIVISFKKSNLLKHNDSVNFLIFHNLDTLSKYLNTQNPIEFLNYIFALKHKSYILLIEDKTNIKYTNGYIFISNLKNPFSLEEISLPVKEEIEDKNTKFKKLSSGAFSTISIIPEQIFLECMHERLNNSFNNVCNILCLSYLSSYTENNNTNLAFHFQGNNKVKLFLQKGCILDTKILIEFYEWVYAEKTEDKLKLFQNIFSNLYPDKEDIESEQFNKVLPHLITRTKENFNFFIQDNIKSFVEERKKVADLVTDTGNQISKEIGKINELLIKLLTGIFISVLTSIIAVVFKIQHINYISYALYLFAVIIIVTTILTSTFSFFNIKISKNLFENRISEYEYLFEDSKFKAIKVSVNSKYKLFICSLFLTNFITLIMSFFIISLGKYFKNNENFFIGILKRIIDIIFI